MLDANKIVLSRTFATKVYRNNTLENKDSQAILLDLAALENCELIEGSRKSVKRKLDGELNESLEKENGHKKHKHKKHKKHKHKKDRKRDPRDSCSISETTSEDQENSFIDVEYIL